MGNKKKYYAVVKGHKPGIYDQWFGENGAEVQIHGYSGAIYKKFSKMEDARSWMKANSSKNIASGRKQEFSGSSEFKNYAKDRTSSYKTSRKLKQTKPDRLSDDSEDKVVIYTDGGCLRNPGPGGFGAVLKFKGHRREISGGYRKTTNNRMELMACIEGLKSLKKRCSVIIYSDSRYVINGIEKGWVHKWRSRGWMRTKTDSAENVDLWEKLLVLCEKHDVEFKWVKGHSGNPENERCDQLARQSALKAGLPPDMAYETGKTRSVAASEYLNS